MLKEGRMAVVMCRMCNILAVVLMHLEKSAQADIMKKITVLQKVSLEVSRLEEREVNNGSRHGTLFQTKTW